MFIKPSFYDDFKCKADKCKDSCCIGWEIGIDKYTLDKYNKVGGEFGEKLRQFIEITDDCSCFKLVDGDRCPFLCENGLCDIYNNLGQSSLCEICTEHPRFYNVREDLTLAGLGLCCEKVCEMLFDNNYTLEFVSDEDIQVSDSLCRINSIISEKETTILEKMNRILLLAGYSSEAISLSNEMQKKIIGAFLATEPINSEWTCYITAMAAAYDEFSVDCLDLYDEDYSKFLAYAVYRHLPESDYDGDFLYWFLFCCISVCFVMMSDIFTYKTKGEYSFEDRIENVKQWSKQIEYSTENIDVVMTEFLIPQ